MPIASSYETPDLHPEIADVAGYKQHLHKNSSEDQDAALVPKCRARLGVTGFPAILADGLISTGG